METEAGVYNSSKILTTLKRISRIAKYPLNLSNHVVVTNITAPRESHA